MHGGLVRSSELEVVSISSVKKGVVLGEAMKEGG